MRKWLKRITLAAAAMLLIGAVAAAWLIWRATRVPAWYAAAVDCALEPAQTAEQGELIGFRNWLARAGAGSLGDLAEADRRYEITLSADQINALLAKWTDNLHGDVQTLRIHLGENQMTLMGMWMPHERVVGLTIDSQPGPGGRPEIAVHSVRAGEQSVSLTWVNAQPVAKLRAMVANLAHGQKSIGIDEHGVATPRTARAYVAAALLELAEGKSIEPIAFLSPRLSIDDTVPLNLVAARASGDHLTLGFQLLLPDEQQSVIDRVNAALNAAK